MHIAYFSGFGIEYTFQASHYAFRRTMKACFLADSPERDVLCFLLRLVRNGFSDERSLHRL